MLGSDVISIHICKKQDSKVKNLKVESHLESQSNKNFPKFQKFKTFCGMRENLGGVYPKWTGSMSLTQGISSRKVQVCVLSQSKMFLSRMIRVPRRKNISFMSKNIFWVTGHIQRGSQKWNLQRLWKAWPWTFHFIAYAHDIYYFF